MAHHAQHDDDSPTIRLPRMMKSNFRRPVLTGVTILLAVAASLIAVKLCGICCNRPPVNAGSTPQPVVTVTATTPPETPAGTSTTITARPAVQRPRPAGTPPPKAQAITKAAPEPAASPSPSPTQGVATPTPPPTPSPTPSRTLLCLLGVCLTHHAAH